MPETGAHRESVLLQRAIGRVEQVLYATIGLLLAAAGVLLLGDTVSGALKASHERAVTDVGLFVLQRVLLMYIIVEMLSTLRLVDFGRRILVEPFLLIGMIAVVRRILVITAQMDAGPSHRQTTDLLIELGAMGGLVIALAVALHLLRARPV